MNDELTALDWIAVSMAAIGVVWVGVLFPFVFGPRFSMMFADFGGKLPFATRLMLARWPEMILAAIPAALLAVALTGSRPLGSRRALIVGAFFASLAGIGFCLWAMYAPIFELAGKIQ